MKVEDMYIGYHGCLAWSAARTSQTSTFILNVACAANPSCTPVDSGKEHNQREARAASHNYGCYSLRFLSHIKIMTGTTFGIAYFLREMLQSCLQRDLEEPLATLSSNTSEYTVNPYTSQLGFSSDARTANGDPSENKHHNVESSRNRHTSRSVPVRMLAVRSM
ncbi:hypothetical protein TMatcc_010660 [Talaromyces marneffei ATCC 18224]